MPAENRSTTEEQALPASSRPIRHPSEWKAFVGLEVLGILALIGIVAWNPVVMGCVADLFLLPGCVLVWIATLACGFAAWQRRKSILLWVLTAFHLPLLLVLLLVSGFVVHQHGSELAERYRRESGTIRDALTVP